MGKSRRLPNAFGSVYRLSGNRRRPWAVAKTFGWDDKGKQIKKIIGYAESKKDAMQLLMEYNKDPYDVDHKKITVEYIYELTIKKYIKMVEDSEMSKSNLQGLKNGFKYCESLYKVPIMNVNYKIMQDILDNCSCGHTIKGYIKNILTKIFEYAKLELGIKIDLELPTNLKIGKKSSSNMHKAFTESEITQVWGLCQDTSKASVEIVLIMLYTGLRPQELIDIETVNININDSYMTGGCKTEAGKNRVIPIHPKIMPFIQKRLNNKYLITVNSRKANYKDISRLWDEVMNELNLEHYPYDARHTLATRLDEYRITHPNSLIDDLTIKKLMGHAIADVTKSVYIHRDVKYLVDAIELIY